MEHLSTFQKGVVDECLKTKKGCLSVPMGGGKTLIALALNERIGGGGPLMNKTLIVCSKSLIESWKHEILKFFGTNLPFESFYPADDDFVPKTDVVITTPSVLTRYYKFWRLEGRLVTKTLEDRDGAMPVVVNRFNLPSAPMLARGQHNCGGFLFSLNWKFVFIDELQEYTNSNTMTCKSIACLFSVRKWGLSGTPLNEPKPERLLGYHLMLGFKNWPNCLPDTKLFIASEAFKGLNASMVIRTPADKDFEAPPVPGSDEIFVEHELTREENLIFQTLKEVLVEIHERARGYRNVNETLRKKFAAYLLTMITYTRQFLTCALVPHTSMALSVLEENDNELAQIYLDKIKTVDLTEYLNDPESAKSSRIEAILKVLDDRRKEKVIVFSCFVPPLNIVESFVTERPTFVMKAKHSPEQRGNLLKEFGDSGNGVLFLTYGLGAEGLNLQCCSNVLLADVWWNCGKVQQAIARVLRRGQQNRVKIYFFTSNTGIECGLFQKHSDKLTVLKELATGKQTSKIKTLSQEKIVSLITGTENLRELKNARFLTK